MQPPAPPPQNLGFVEIQCWVGRFSLWLFALFVFFIQPFRAFRQAELLEATVVVAAWSGTAVVVCLQGVGGGLCRGITRVFARVFAGVLPGSWHGRKKLVSGGCRAVCDGLCRGIVAFAGVYQGYCRVLCKGCRAVCRGIAG